MRTVSDSKMTRDGERKWADEAGQKLTAKGRSKVGARISCCIRRISWLTITNRSPPDEIDRAMGTRPNYDEKESLENARKGNGKISMDTR